MTEKKISNQEQIKTLLQRMSVGIYGKECIISKALLCSLAGESMFLLGPPGTAKSLIARRLKTIFKGAKAFEYLMSRFSTPDEIFGPVSIAKLKNEDKYERLVTDYLPDASIVFLDEIWKAGPAIQNSLLTAINERIYKNGSSLINLPMKVLIAASNELPEEGQGLEALWDRFLIRMVSNCIEDEALFFDMVKADIPSEITLPDNLLISDDEYASWQEEIKKVVIPDDICKIASCIRQRLVTESEKDEHQKADFYVSDRRWKKIFHLMQTSAFINGRSTIDITDCLVMIHCLWNHADHIPIIISCVCRSILWQVEDIIEKVEHSVDSIEKVHAAKANSKNILPKESFDLVDIFYYELEGYPKGRCLIVASEFKHLKTDSDTAGIIFYEEKKKAWIIHVLYFGNPFESVLTRLSSSTKIKLKRTLDGITFNGTTYNFVRNDNNTLRTATNRRSPSQFTRSLKEELDEACKIMNEIESRFVSHSNILNTKDEIELIRHEISQYQIRIDVLGKRIHTKK
jgi:MoxR-like ATPase